MMKEDLSVLATLDKSFDRVGGSGARRSLLRTESATRRAFLTDTAFVRRNEVSCNVSPPGATEETTAESEEEGLLYECL